MAKKLVATDLFGGKQVLAEGIVQVLRTHEQGREFFGEVLEGDDAIKVLSQIPKSRLTRFFFLNELSSSKVFPPINWGDDREEWAAQNRVVSTVGSNGQCASSELSLRLHVQQTALDEVCAPSRVLSDEETKRLESFRERYKSAVSP